MAKPILKKNEDGTGSPMMHMSTSQNNEAINADMQLNESQSEYNLKIQHDRLLLLAIREVKLPKGYVRVTIVF